MSWHDEKDRPIYAEIDRVTAQKVAAMSETNREAIDAACIAYHGKDCWLGLNLSCRDFERRHFSDALTAALPHLLAAKGAEIAALRYSVTELLQNAGWSNMTDDELREEERLGNGMAPVILRGRAALEMSGG
jgi:hypothetical protein